MFKEIETFISKKKGGHVCVCVCVCVGGGGGGGKKKTEKKIPAKTNNNFQHLLNNAIDHICSKQRSNQIFKLKIKMIHVRKVFHESNCYLFLALSSMSQ